MNDSTGEQKTPAQLDAEAKATADVAQAKKDAPEPNIVFVGKTEPFTKINNGMETIKLPKAEDQATVEVDPDSKQNLYSGIPFFHERAGTIVQLFGTHYKFFKPKGK